MLGTVQVLQGWEKFRSMSGNIQQLLQILQMTVQSYLRLSPFSQLFTKYSTNV